MIWVRRTAISAIRFSVALILADSSLWWAVAAAGLFLQHCILQQVMISEIVHGLRHLFQIKDLGPSRISGTFPAWSFAWMSTSRLTFGRSARLARLLDGAYAPFDRRGWPTGLPGCSHHPDCPGGILYSSRGASNGRISRAWILHSQIFGAASATRQVGRLCSKALSMATRSNSRWEGLTWSPQPLIEAHSVGLGDSLQ